MKEPQWRTPDVLPVGGWGTSSWPPGGAGWRCSTAGPASLLPGPALSSWTHTRWRPAGRLEWPGDSSCPKLQAAQKVKGKIKRETVWRLLRNNRSHVLLFVIHGKPNSFFSPCALFWRNYLPLECQAAVSPWRESGWTDETELPWRIPPSRCIAATPRRSESRWLLL